jgi:hypothetical protein
MPHNIDDEFARVRAMIFEPYTLFRVAPIAGRHVNVSEQGFRAGSGPLPWPPEPDFVNIFVFGGSMAFGYGVRDADTVPAQMGALLAETADKFRVYNFANPNFDGTQNRIRLEQLLLHGARPDAVVFIDGFANFIAPYYAPMVYGPFVDALTPRTLFHRVMDRRPESRSGEKDACHVPDARAVVEEYFTNRKMIESVCDAFDVRPLFVWQPAPCYRYDGDASRPHAGAHGPEAKPLLDAVREGYDLMDARRKPDDLRFLWIADMQAGRMNNLYVDADHYTPEFSREIAAKIANRLRDILPAKPIPRPTR